MDLENSKDNELSSDISVETNDTSSDGSDNIVVDSISDDSFDDLENKIYANTDYEELPPAKNRSTPTPQPNDAPPKKLHLGICFMIIVLLFLLIWCARNIDPLINGAKNIHAMFVKEKPDENALENLTIYVETATIYDVDTSIPVKLSVAPATANIDNLVCESSGGIFTKDGQELSFSADSDGMYILCVSSGNIKSNEITIEVEDKIAKTEREDAAQKEAQDKAVIDAQIAAAQAQARQESESQQSSTFQSQQQAIQQPQTSSYVVNTSTDKFHKPSCRDVSKIAPENYWAYDGTRDDLINQGYSPCGHCNP